MESAGRRTDHLGSGMRAGAVRGCGRSRDQEVARGGLAGSRPRTHSGLPPELGRGIASDSPSQVIFFNDGTPLGTATPEPRPYITVVAQGNDSAAVQYQWRQGQDPACCPTGIGTVRFKVEDGKLKALDPIPNP